MSKGTRISPLAWRISLFDPPAVGSGWNCSYRGSSLRHLEEFLVVICFRLLLENIYFGRCLYRTLQDKQEQVRWWWWWWWLCAICIRSVVNLQWFMKRFTIVSRVISVLMGMCPSSSDELHYVQLQYSRISNLHKKVLQESRHVLLFLILLTFYSFVCKSVTEPNQYCHHLPSDLVVSQIEILSRFVGAQHMILDCFWSCW